MKHTVPTLMLEENVHPLVVSKLLGHARIETTLDCYTHGTETLQRDAVTTLGASLERKSPK